MDDVMVLAIDGFGETWKVYQPDQISWQLSQNTLKYRKICAGLQFP